ncbi:class I tRNA ligase family protein, partial [Candidatus Parcubacteria bacterium]|nr:class I tRNA ligase family protein [Candidatus Parcubacteria bacterium]
EDVLDTWFSSALWPLGVFGWPENTKDLKEFYPTSFLSTARDIINLWVARMIMFGLEFKRKVPFKIVFVHPTVLTKEGKRMSKSLGTGIDPLVLIEKYGADATRIGLIWQAKGGQDLRFDESFCVAGKKFCNKVWNASRFVLLNLEKKVWKMEELKLKKLLPKTSQDKEMIRKVKNLIEKVDKDLENFQFGKAMENIYHFVWHQFCDKYIEVSKEQLKNEKLKENTQKILLSLLLCQLKLLHPFAPFLTETLYQKLPILDKKEFLMIESWPKKEI